MATPPREKQLAEGFARDGHVAMLELWRREPNALIVRDPQASVFFRLCRSPRTCEIVVRARGHDSRMALMQAVRELAMDRVVASGGSLVHAAVARGRNGALVVSGPKGSGKTTLLLALLEHAGLSYLSNDRCVLRVGDGEAVVRGLPTIVSVTRAGLEAFPDVRRRLFAVRPDLPMSGSTSVGVGPQQFARLFSTPRSWYGVVGAFVFPRVTPGGARLALRRLDRGEAIECFRAGLFRAGQRTVLGEVFAVETAPGTSAEETGEAVGRWVADHVPCFSAELGGEGPPDADDCRALLARVGIEGFEKLP